MSNRHETCPYRRAPADALRVVFQNFTADGAAAASRASPRAASGFDQMSNVIRDEEISLAGLKPQ